MSKANCDKVVTKAITFNTTIEGSDKKVAYDAFILAPLFAGEPKANKALFNSIFGEEGAKSFKAMLRQQLAFSFGTENNEPVELTGELVAEIAAAQKLISSETTPELLTKRQDDILVALNATVAEYYAEEIKGSADTELDEKGVPTWESEFMWVGSNCATAKAQQPAQEQPAPATEPTTAQAAETPAPQEQVVEAPTATTEAPATETPSNLPAMQSANSGVIISDQNLATAVKAIVGGHSARRAAQQKLLAALQDLNAAEEADAVALQAITGVSSNQPA